MDCQKNKTQEKESHLQGWMKFTVVNGQQYWSLEKIQAAKYLLQQIIRFDAESSIFNHTHNKSTLIRLLSLVIKIITFKQTNPIITPQMQALPVDIRNLPRYYVPIELFICTCIILIFFLVWTLAMFLIWAWRSRRHIHNYEYVADHNIRREFEHAKKTIKEKMEREREEQNEVFHSEVSESNQTRYSPQLEATQMVYNRQESRLLEFACLSVMVAININSFTCNIMEVVTYLVAVVVFTVFNVFRVAERIKFLRLIFFLPLIAAYLPFLIFKKELKTI